MRRDARRPAALIAAAVILLITHDPVAAGVVAARRPPPPELVALAARARVDGAIAAWCRGRFRPGHPRAFAAAFSSGSSGGGRYVVLEADGAVDELEPFAGPADLSCYTRAEARRLDATIQRSDTIRGHVAPRSSSTVVCGFTDATTAACWQYSAADRAFVKIGGWTT